METARVRDLLYESPRTIVWREHAPGGPTVVKAPCTVPVHEREVGYYRRAEQVARRAPGLTPRTRLEMRSGVPHLVMSEIDGRTLDEVISTGAAALPDALSIGVNLAVLLGRFHDLGLVHADFEPSNIWLDDAGRPVLLDLESVIGVADGHRHDDTPVRSPEHAERNESVLDARSDLYGLGLVLLELLGLERLHGSRGAEWTARIRRGFELHPDPGFPPVVCAIVERLLEPVLGERYQSAGTVAADLRRCLNAWNVARAIPVFDLAPNRVAPALELEVGLIGRDAELAVLADVVATSGSARGRSAIVEGDPGVGKSSLLRAFAADVTGTGAVFAYGKIEQGRSEPFAALAQALSEVVHDMLGSQPGEFEAWREELEATVRPTGAALAALIPDLHLVLPGLEPLPALPDAEARIRLHRTVAALIVATTVIRPVVLVIDDLQWIDADTERVLLELVSSRLRNFTFIGAHRSAEYAASKITADPAAVHVLLGGLTEIEIGSMLEKALGGEAAVAGVARMIFDRCGGNPLYAKQLVRQAQQVGLLRFEAVHGRWVWDRAGMARLPAADNVVHLLVESLEQLSPAHVEVISCVACIGGDFSIAAAQAVSARSDAEVADALWAGLELRLIEPASFGMPGVMRVLDTKLRYRFSHDRVAEAAISRLSPHERAAAHLRFGRRLLETESSASFLTVHHLNKGGRLVTEAAERRAIARLNVEAAQLARQKTDFSLARDFYEAGIELLGDDGWSQDRSLACALHVGAAETHLMVGDTAEAHRWLDTAVQHIGETSTEGIQAAFIRMRSLSADHQLQEAIETGMTALRALGEPIPEKASKVGGAAAIMRSRFKLRPWTDEQIRSMPLCEDERILEVDRILDELLTISYLARPELFPVIVHKAIALTLEHGLLPISPGAFANHGLLLVVAFSRHDESQRWGELALSLCEAGPLRSQLPSVQFVYYNFISHWKHPMRGAIEPLRRAHRQALLAADIETAAWVGVVAIYQSFNLGLPLSDVDSLAETVIPTFSGQLVQSTLARSTQQLCLNLMGRADDPLLLAGESGFDERDALAHGEAQQDVVTVAATAITKMGLHFWHGDYAGVIEQAAVLEPHLGGMSGTPNVPAFHLMNAYGRLKLHPRSRQTRRAVRAALKRFARWGDSCEANYGTSRDLLHGIRAVQRGETAEAERFLDSAVNLADRHRLAHYGALAREELGALYSETGRTALARSIIRDAYEQWESVGIVPRKEGLIRQYPWLDRVRASASSGTLDLPSLLTMSQELSGEIQLEGLLERLVQSAGRLTGATRVLLFTPAPGHPVCRVLHDATGTHIFSELGATVEAPYTIVRYVQRTGRPLRLHDATSSAHGSDPYVRETGARSTLSIPIHINHNSAAVLHLEVPAAAGAFSVEHQQSLMMLSGQIGASLQNAQLVDQLEHALDSQTALASAQSRFIPDEFLELFGADDIRSVQVGDTVEHRMTILVSDIRGYTRLVEQMSLPEAGRLAIDFLRSVEPAIIGNNGFVQDMRGDEVLALFARDPADAVRAGLAMQRSQAANNELRQRAGGPVVSAGLGITTGDVMLTMVGGVNRMTCGVIGDAVNLASRVEALHKRYGSGVLIDENTRNELPSEAFHIRRMERVRVVNRNEPVTVYEVYDDDEPALRERKQLAQPLFDEAFALFDSGRFASAANAFERCLATIPGDSVAELHHRLCSGALSGTADDVRVTELTEK